MPSVSLQLPPQDLDGFPCSTIARNRNLWRFGLSDHGPWWFSSSGGRFDLQEPGGTCYVALDQIGAILEVIGREHTVAVVPKSTLTKRVMWRLKPSSTLRVADATDRLASRFGVTGEISTIVPYDQPQAWAVAFWEAGMDGIRYALRHDPAMTGAVAIFGSAGEREGWPYADREVVGSRLTRRLEQELGVTVIDVPSSRELRVIDEDG